MEFAGKVFSRKSWFPQRGPHPALRAPHALGAPARCGRRSDGAVLSREVFLGYLRPRIILAGLKPRGSFIFPVCMACSCFIIFCMSRNWFKRRLTS